MPGPISHDMSVSWNSAPLLGPCRKSRPRLILCDWHSLRISTGHLNWNRHFHMGAHRSHITQVLHLLILHIIRHRWTRSRAAFRAEWVIALIQSHLQCLLVLKTQSPSPPTYNPWEWSPLIRFRTRPWKPPWLMKTVGIRPALSSMNSRTSNLWFHLG